MTTSTSSTATHDAVWPPNVMPLSALVAVDGSEPANAAMNVAAALAAAGRIMPTLMSVLEMGPHFPGTPMLSPAAITNALLGHDGEDERVRAVRAQASESVRAAADWPVRLGVGDAATVIDEGATAAGATLIIMGLQRHGRVGRALGDETTLNVVRRGHVAVLAVAPSLHRVPLTIVVGTDFSQASRRAAMLAAQLLAPGGRLVLVHAEAMFDYASEDREGYGVIHDEGVRAGFARIREELMLPANASVDTMNIDATANAALLDVAARVSADVIAVGRQHHTLAARMLLGSVTTQLIREGRCSVLVTPLTLESGTD